MHFDRKLICLACSSLLWLACSSDDQGSMEGPMLGGGEGGAGMATGGASGAMASGGAGGTVATGGMGSSGAGGTAGDGAGGAAGDVVGTGGVSGVGDTGGMGASGGMGGDDDGPNSVSANPDGVDALQPLPEDVTLPIVFVHGFAGSAQQYDSQMQRFVANGYPRDRIIAYDHDGAGFDTATYANGVDQVIDKALEDFGVSKVYLVGHSRGTFVSTSYLGSAARAAKVAKYISLDGAGCAGITIPCIEPSQSAIPGQSHVEISTSPESFEMQYEFLVGEPPAVTAIVAQKEPVTLTGRVVNFPANTGRPGVKVEVWALDDETGYRAADEPLAMFDPDAEGGWGPVTVDSRKRYEFAVVPTDGSTTQHIYMQKFLRDSGFVRLLSGDATSATRMNTNTSDNHSTLVLMRMREWYATDNGSTAGDQTDTLEIETTSASAGDEPKVNALPRFIGNATIGVHVHDAAASPGDSTLTALPYFQTQAFQNGVDVFMPAADPPDGTITISNNPRGDTSKVQVIHVPNWVSSHHAMTVLFSDYAQ